LEKKIFARASVTWNLSNSTFRSLFPTFVPELEKLHNDAVMASESEAKSAICEKSAEVPRTDLKLPDAAPREDVVAPKRHILSGKWLKIMFVAVAAFAVAVRAFTHSVSS
jgi:hypothetical protein